MKSLSSALTQAEKSEVSNHSEESIHDDLDWMETGTKIDDQDLVDSINIHKRILDSEIDTIDKELDHILKNKETVEYLVSLLKKREKLESQVHRLEDDLQEIQVQKEG